MKLILLSDTHYGFSPLANSANEGLLEHLKESENIVGTDIFIHTGDVGDFIYFSIFREYFPSNTVLFTQGNHDVWKSNNFESLEDVINKYETILRKYNITHLPGGSYNGKNFCIASYDSWYAVDGDSNDKIYVPNFLISKEILRDNSDVQFKMCLKDIQKAKEKNRTTILFTHFGCISSLVEGKPNYSGSTTYETFLDNVDYFFMGHIHTPQSGLAMNGKTKFINVGSDYNNPRYQIVDLGE